VLRLSLMVHHVTYMLAPDASVLVRLKEQSNRQLNLNASLTGCVFLAPMAGMGDFAMRSMCRKFGSKFVCGEMASSIGIVMGTEDSRKLIDLKDEHLYSVQLFGNDPTYFSKATEIVKQYSPDIIDINMGCPAPKVTNNGSGSALLNNLPLAYDILRATKDSAGDIPVTVKIRIGFGPSSDVVEEMGEIAEKSGCSAITLHARTRAQMYAPSADWTAIKRLKQSVSIPVIGNGDVCSISDAKRMMEETGCDAVMIGRAAMGHPWIFKEGYEPTFEERMDLMFEEMNIRVKDKGNYIAFREGRKHVMNYMNGLRGAASLRRMCAQIESFEDLEAIKKEALRLQNL